MTDYDFFMQEKKQRDDLRKLARGDFYPDRLSDCGYMDAAAPAINVSRFSSSAACADARELLFGDMGSLETPASYAKPRSDRNDVVFGQEDFMRRDENARYGDFDSGFWSPKPLNYYSDYTDYMREQWSRPQPAQNPILSEEDFYRAKFGGRAASIKAAESNKSGLKKRLSKGGKIFIAGYISIIIAIASIIAALA
jgi:hypothetical protein